MPTRRNRIIAMLPESVAERIEHESRIMTCESNEVLLDAGEAIGDLFFPIDAVVSLDQVIDPNENDPMSAPGVAVIGNEAVAGLEAFFGAELAINRATVRIAGSVLRVNAGTLHREFMRAGAFQRAVLRSADALFTQICANGACERVHPIEQRLIRWLLLFDDRCKSHELSLTQSTLAHLLGVRRVSISAAAVLMQLAQQISYHRGTILLRDRAALEAKACNCYRQIKARYENDLHSNT